MLQISVGCIQVLVRPKAWYPDHIKFWELQSWGPNACLTKASHQIAPPVCQPLTQHLAQQPPKAKRVLSPHWFHEHSSQLLGEKGHTLPASLTSLRHTRQKKPALLLPVSCLWQCPWFFCLCFTISKPCKTGRWPQLYLTLSPHPVVPLLESSQASSLPTCPRGCSGGDGGSCNSQQLTPPEDWPFQASLSPLELSSSAPTKLENSFLKWS